MQATARLAQPTQQMQRLITVAVAVADQHLRAHIERLVLAVQVFALSSIGVRNGTLCKN
jgi:hypothetical protein